MISQRTTLAAEIALPPQSVALPEGKRPDEGNAILLAQAPPIVDSDAPSERNASMAGSSSEPQTGAQETISVARQLNPTQRRRRPKMAGVPSGSQTIAQPPESAPATQQAEAGNAEPAVVVSATPQPTPVQQANTQTSLSEDETHEAGEDNSPGAIAQRKAEYAQGINRQYTLAPIRWRGQVFELVARRTARVWGTQGTTPTSALTGIQVLSPTPSTFYRIQGVTTEASTFILAPWVATVFGRLGVIGRNIRYYSGEQSNEHNNRIIGGINLSAFSQSRYPFTMTLDVVDSRVNNQISESNNNNNLDSVSNTLNLTQGYRPINSPSHYSFNYDYNNTNYQSLSSYNNNNQAVQSISNYTTASSSLGGNYSTRFGQNLDQPFNLTGNHYSYSNTLLSGGTLTRDIISGNHIYTPEETLLTLRSFGSYINVNQNGNTSRTLQLSSNATWQPEDLDNPLVLRSNAQLVSSQSQTSAGSSDTSTLGVNVLATYNKWAYLLLNGGGSLTSANSDGVSSLVSTQFGNATYTPGTIRLSGGKTYYRSASGGFLNQISSDRSSSSFSTNANLTQGLKAPFTTGLFGYNTRFSTRLDQSIGVVSGTNGTNETLNHTGTIIWIPLGLRQQLPRTSGTVEKAKGSSHGAANLVSSLTLRAYDYRTYGSTQSHRQSFSLTAGAGAGGAYSAVGSGYGGSADATIQLTRTTSGGDTGSLAGNATWGHAFLYNYRYRKHNVFNVKGLNYGLVLSANVEPELRARTQTNLQTSQSFTNNSQYVGYGLSLTQTLQYRIGQNEVLISALIGNSYGLNTASLFLRFRAWRNFGN